MKLNPTTINIGVVHKHYVPTEWFDEFQANLIANNVNIETKKENPRINNYSGPDFYDIIIYIKDSPESIILAPAVYDILKYSIVKIYRKLKGTEVQRISSDKIGNISSRKMSIKYQDGQNRQIDISIESNLIQNQTEDFNFLLKAIEILEDQKREPVFRQKKFVDNRGQNPRIEMEYNAYTKDWQPIDFDEKLKELDEELKKRMSEFGH